MARTTKMYTECTPKLKKIVEEEARRQRVSRNIFVKVAIKRMLEGGIHVSDKEIIDVDKPPEELPLAHLG